MSRKSKIAIITAVIIIVVGIILCVIALVNGGRQIVDEYRDYLHKEQQQSYYELKEYAFSAAELNELYLSAVGDDVHLFINQDAEEIKIICPDSSDYHYLVETSGDRLSVVFQEGEGDSFSLNDWFNGDDHRIDIWLPQSFLNRGILDLDVISSDIQFAGIEGANLTAVSVSGDINLDGCSFNQMSLETVSGDIDVSLSAPSAGYQLDYDTVSGEAEIGRQLLAATGDKKITANTVSGDMEIYAADE